MKATGIVRNLDNLGRVVIPKEIRRTLQIREGDPLEIFTDKGGEVIFRKYSHMGERSRLVDAMCETLHKTTGKDTAICDRDTVIAAHVKGKSRLVDADISDALKEVMEGRSTYRYDSSATVQLTEYGNAAVTLAVPIITAGDVMGCVVFASDDVTESDAKLAQMVAVFLANEITF